MSFSQRISFDRRGRILPREQGALSLDLVIAIMAFLAALALGGVMIAERSVQSWQAGLTGRLTVQVLPQGASPPETEVNAAVELLRNTPGVVYAAPLSDDQNLELIEPWLGRNTAVASLPFPRLIDVRLVPGATPDLEALTTQLKDAAPHAVLDDHGRWIERLRSTADVVVLSALVILALIAIGTAASVAFATRAGLAAHREIVELLHLMGAQDHFIARAFERHYFLAAFAASAVGSALAGGAFVAASGLDQFGLPAVSFLPPLGLSVGELFWLLLVPATSALIAWATARLSVISVLHQYY
jgi:cell division transport system permease protein